MKTSDFEYHSPRTIDDALTLLSRLADQDARILAGGQSLVPTMAFRLASPQHLIDINRVEGFDRLTVADGHLVIGACVRHAAFHSPVLEGPLGVLLADVVQHIAHYPVRSRGTFCGSLAHADPASEWCLVAATLGASMVAASVRGDRIIPAGEYFDGLMTTALAEDEILREVRIPLPAPDTRYGFYEFNRRAGDYAIGMALVGARLVDGRIADIRFGLGGAESFPRRIGEVEAALAGAEPSPELFASVAAIAAEAIDPIEDLQADEVYRRDIARAVSRRALARCFAG